MSSSSSSSAAPRIFSPAEWKNLYSDEDYKKTERVQPHLFHFLIARGHAQDDLISRINTTKNPNKLIAHDPQNHGLTPLIIAAMSGNERIVEELLKQDLVKKNINDTDEYGWTALHHAALTSDTIFQKLLAAGAKENPLTKLKGTPADLRAFATPGIKDDSIQSVSFEGKTLTREIAQEKFGLTYRDISFYPPERLKDLWKEEEYGGKTIVESLKETLKPRPPQVEISLLDAGFYGLSARERMTPGTFVGEYAGERINNERDCRFFPEAFPRVPDERSTYRCGEIDAKWMGNSTRFINNGFPNTLSLAAEENGVHKGVLTVADTIEQGEPILFSYGARAYEVTYGPQILFNRDKIHSFFKQGLTSIEQQVDAIDKRLATASGNNRAPLILQRGLLWSRLCFPIDNPPCLIDLHFSKIIDAKEWLKPLIGKNVDWIDKWIAEHGALVATHMREMLIRLSKIDQNIQKNTPNHYPLFQNWVLRHCQTLTLVDLIKGMDWIEEALVIKKDPTLVDGIEARLGSYDWDKDQAHLYSYANRKAGFERYVDLTLLQDKQVNDSNFFEAKLTALTDFLEDYETRNGFENSELETMVYEILNSIPEAAAAQAQYLAKAKAERKEIQNLAK